MEKDIRILLVDDHPAVREGLQRMLEREKDMEVVGQSANGEEALLQAERLCPNIAIVDIRMPGMSGIELTQQIREKFPSCKVIILSLYDEYLPQAMEAGASGYLLKDINGENLAQVIRHVHSGEVVISGGISSTARIEYEQRRAEKSGEDPDAMEEVQLVIPPIEPNHLIGFVSQVEEMLSCSVRQVVSSWPEGTAIILSLMKASSLADILNKLREMPEVAEIVEKLPTKENHLYSLLKKAAGMRRNPKPQKIILVTLKQLEKQSKEVK